MYLYFYNVILIKMIIYNKKKKYFVYVDLLLYIILLKIIKYFMELGNVIVLVGF